MRMQKHMSGLSLIELLVGVAIGLLATLVISQTIAVSEGFKRTTTSGSDAQVNGALALYTIERDVKMAGYGFTGDLNALGCQVKMKYGANPTMSLNLIPLSITDGTDGAPDQLQILASSKSGWALPTRITVDHPATAANFFVNSDLGIQENDLMIAVPGDPSKWCTVIQVTKDPVSGNNNGSGGGQGQNQVLHNSGQSDWNQAGGQNIFPPGGYAANDYLINLGSMINRTYAINTNRNLQLTTFLTTTGTNSVDELYPDIVNLQAQYGKDDGSNGGTADDGVVDGYDNVSPTTGADWRRVITIRLAILARSGLRERDEVTHTAPSWSGGSFVMTGITDWQYYRYKAFETIVPLRNVIWHQ